MEERDEIGFYLKRINDFLLASANAHLKELDLTFSQFHLLAYILERQDKNVLQKEIEQNFGLKHPTVVGLLRRMEKKELIRVEENPADRRGNRVVALDKGIRVGREMLAGKLCADDILTCDLDEKQKEELKALLRIVYTKTCMGPDGLIRKIRPMV